VQTALLQVARKWRRIRGEPTPYARRAVVNLAKNHWRDRFGQPQESTQKIESGYAAVPVGKSENPAGAWFWTNGQCVFVGVEWADTKPAAAAPVRIKNYPGLYRTLENGVVTICAPVVPGTNDTHPTGGWVSLTMSASAPQEAAVRLVIVPAD
jgi:hypothetical protein